MVPITRSARDTLLRKTVPTAPIAGSRKSERLEKKTPPSLAAAKGNSCKKKTVVAATPLRRSERRAAKNLSSSASGSHSSTTSSPSKGSNSKSSGSSSSSGSKASPKKKRKCVKKFSVEEEKEGAGEEEERDVESDSKVNSKKLNARVYRASFNKPEGDCHEESNKMDKSTQEGGNNGSSKMPKDVILPSEDAKAKETTAESRLSGPVKELGENNATLGSLVPSSAADHEARLASEDAKAKDTTAESRLSGPVKEFLENNVTLGSLVPSNATNHKARSAPECNQSDCRGEETSQMLVSRKLMRAESRLSGPAKELSQNNATLGSLVPSNATNHKSSEAPESDQDRKETSQMLLSGTSVLNENLIQNCVGHEKGENLISSKRKGTMMDMHSNVSATLVADASRLCGNNAGTNGPCSKRIRRISLSDVQRDQRKLINNVDQLSSKVEESTGNKEDKPRGNDVEHIRKQQRSLHLLLKPEIAKLCEILLLPDDVKKMVDFCLDYVLNNRQICTKPVSILQAFQLSLCWIAASLLKHKLDFEASIKLAKRHLNFSCKKDMVDVIYSRLWELKEEILFHIGNRDVIDSPKASESSKMVYSYTEVAPEVDLANKDIPKSTKGIQKCENQLRKLLLMQQEEKQKLKVDIEKEKADFERRYKIEGATIQCCSPNDVMRREKLKFFHYEYDKRVRELKRQHEIRLKDLEAKQLDTMQKFNNTVEAMTRAGSGVGLSKYPDSNSPAVVLCSSPVEVQTPLVKHAGANEMDIMASEDGPISPNKCHSIDENGYKSQGNIISKDSNCRERCSGGAISMADEGQGCESRNVCGQDTVTLSQLSSNGEMCDWETSDVPNGEVALAMRKTSNRTDDQDKVTSSRREKLDGTILSKPVCEDAAQIHEADDSNDSNNGKTPNLPSSDERIASLNLKSPQDHVHSLNAMCLPNSENSAQMYEGDDGNSLNNAFTLNSPLTDERIAAGAIVSDRELHVEMPGTVNFSHCPENVTAVNPPSSMQQISEAAVNVSVLDREFSRPCGTASPSNGPDANAITILNQPSLEKQNPDGASSSIPPGQIAVEVPETSHEEASVSDRESPVGMLSSPMDQISAGGSVLDGISSSRPCGASSASNGLAMIRLLNTPSLQQQIPDRISLSIPDGQISVVVPESSHEVAEFQLTDTVSTSTTSDRQERVPTMTENTLPQEASVSRPVDITEPLEQVQPLSSAQSPPDPDTAREMQNSLVSGLVDIVPANQSNHASLVVEPTEQARQLPCAELLSSNQDPSNLPSPTGVEHQQTNEDNLSIHVPDASIEVPNQAVEHRASNLDLDSPRPAAVRTQTSDMRNLSTPSEFNNHHIQTATVSASRIVPPLSLDPLKNELEIIRKLAEKNMKNHEDTKLQLKSDYEKELEELHRKYEVKFHDTEVEFQQQRMDLYTRFKTVVLNKALAEAFRYKFMDHKVPGASGMQQEASFTQQLLQLITQQNATWRPPVAGFSPCGPPAASLQSSYTTTSSQSAVPPPTRPAYNTSGIFSSVSARPPHTNSIPSPSGNFQASGEIRSPAPHLQPYRPSMPVPASSPGTVPPRVMPSPPASGNIPVTPPSFSGRPRLQLSNCNQSDPHQGPSPASTGGLPTPNLSAIDLRKHANSQSGINMPNFLPRLSHLASLDLISRLGTSSSRPANSSIQAASSDIVCLSADE